MAKNNVGSVIGFGVGSLILLTLYRNGSLDGVISGVKSLVSGNRFTREFDEKQGLVPPDDYGYGAFEFALPINSPMEGGDLDLHNPLLDAIVNSPYVLPVGPVQYVVDEDSGAVLGVSEPGTPPRQSIRHQLMPWLK